QPGRRKTVDELRAETAAQIRGQAGQGLPGRQEIRLHAVCRPRFPEGKGSGGDVQDAAQEAERGRRVNVRWSIVTGRPSPYSGRMSNAGKEAGGKKYFCHKNPGYGGLDFSHRIVRPARREHDEVV